MRVRHAAVVLLVTALSGVAPALAPSGPRASGASFGVLHAQRPPVRDSTARDTTRRDSTARDTTRRNPLDMPLLGQGSTLSVDLRARLEARAERLKNDRCVAGVFGTAFRCSATFQPTFDFQLNLLSSGTVGEAVHVNVDYDTQREFDASNQLSLAWRGKDGRGLSFLEVGNVSFAPPVSRFLTAGIPANNYGILAGGQVGNMRYSAIAAQQKGNVVRDQVFTVGDRTRRTLERAIEDYQVEPRRFFWTVDPAILGNAWPNVDILDTRRMEALA